ncbi:ATP-dependent Clp protease ATP-binding subunit [Alkalihalobacillus sp. LMS39]|uniref:ATP-dependent Clp protease ATP-binding subunit n=1 Tax=Alkalihalobacillus sp. LMS39 TaxID=2924032 RepID=UPI001FB55098|nr:ATP-dependent Clp protease ATP-binding subunit [Alkalihalobacillus sp. LMS39]UOE92540.1 AAA family ATPase [Alkalihalobacillus sp. LMS39]
MKCQVCNNNQASIQVHVSINNTQRLLHLCESCFTQVHQPNTMNNLSGNEFFHSLFHQQQGQSQTKTNENDNTSHPFLDEFGRNLTTAAKHGEIDTVIGRDDEIQRMVEVLSRRTKNNPVLIGEAGVGKTAIAEGLALRIVEGNVPRKMKNKQVYVLDMSTLVAGTSYRGQFEEKIKQLISELEKQQDTIIFIDEIHQIVGAGATEGSMDASNILKPALARGKLQLIGATTVREFRMIEKDPALERRFQPIIVKEPSFEKAVEILKGIRPLYEQYHEVRYSDEVIHACVSLSSRYIQDRYLPDKAIDLLDEIGAKLSLEQEGSPTVELEQRLEKIAALKVQATEREDYETAATLRVEELQIEDKLKNIPNEAKTVTIEHIQALIEKKTGIPVMKLQKAEQEKMKELEKQLASKIIGQNEAVTKVAKAIKRQRAGLKPKNRPISFMFVGPTGVGKTELTKSLANELFGKKDAMIRLDMSEFMEKHSVSKFIGSPPGYVGFDEGGQLTEKVRRNPYSILLLDEIEKAHPDVMHLFLQILEDGHLTDSQGRVVSFKDTVIIMTSNAGIGQKKISVGFEQQTNNENQHSSPLTDSLRSFFKPEFLNRIDSIIEFKPLQKEALIEIVDLLIHDVVERLAELQLSLDISEEAKVKLADVGYSPAFGARPLRRVIQEKIEDSISEYIIDNPSATHFTIELIDDEITVSAK